jgi:hypothetical protein
VHTNYTLSGVSTADGQGNVTFTFDQDNNGSTYTQTQSSTTYSMGPANDEGSFSWSGGAELELLLHRSDAPVPNSSGDNAAGNRQRQDAAVASRSVQNSRLEAGT